MIENRLKDLMEIHDLTNQELADSVGLELGTLNTYISTKSNSRDLPVNVAIDIANEYHTTLDWIYGNSSFLTEQDSRVDILFCLRKVFQIGFDKRIEKFANEEIIEKIPVLLIDNKFRTFLFNIKNLEADKVLNELDDEEYSYKLNLIYKKYKGYFKEIFNREMIFNPENASKLFDVEDIYENEDNDLDPLNII